MAERDGAPDGTDRLDRIEHTHAQASRAHENARYLAGRLAETARELAGTLDRVAETREARAGQTDGDEAADHSRSARRARRKAQGERDDRRRLQEDWDLPEQ